MSTLRERVAEDKTFRGRSGNYVYREKSHINKGIHVRIPQMTDSCCNGCLFIVSDFLVSIIQAVILHQAIFLNSGFMLWDG